MRLCGTTYHITLFIIPVFVFEFDSILLPAFWLMTMTVVAIRLLHTVVIYFITFRKILEKTFCICQDRIVNSGVLSIMYWILLRDYFMKQAMELNEFWAAKYLFQFTLCGHFFLCSFTYNGSVKHQILSFSETLWW